MGGARAVFLCFILLSCGHAWSAAPASSFHSRPVLEAGTLGTIAGWLKRDGRDGWLGADVADAVGIPRLATEDLLEARQRGYRDDEALRVVQASADERRDFLLFMVQRPDGQVFFYLASLREGLKGCFVSAQGVVAPPDRLEAQAAFERELSFWEGRVAAVR